MSVIPEAGRGCRIVGFIISFSYIVSLMSTWVTSDTLSQNKETKKIKTKDYHFLSLMLKSFLISQER